MLTIVLVATRRIAQNETFVLITETDDIQRLAGIKPDLITSQITVGSIDVPTNSAETGQLVKGFIHPY